MSSLAIGAEIVPPKPFPTAGVVLTIVGGGMILVGGGLLALAVVEQLRYDAAELPREEAAAWEQWGVVAFAQHGISRHSRRDRRSPRQAGVI